MENASFLVVNRPSAWTSNISKPYQQQLIAAAGFHVPRTLVTNCPAEARAFYERCRQRVIYKSVSGHRSIVVRLTDADLDRLDEVKNCPTQFQEWIPGTDVRVHIIGRRVFATEISTEALDYRYAGRQVISVRCAPWNYPRTSFAVAKNWRQASAWFAPASTCAGVPTASIVASRPTRPLPLPFTNSLPANA